MCCLFLFCVWMCLQALDILKTADVHRGKENRIQRDGTNEQRDIKKPSWVQGGTPPVISWFINHSKYRYIYHKP